ncbi:MAG: NUDIX domain-containing protein [Eubacteriales bacterium]|nr:NUDIX domain-containing protein [Eubacteriales bacterium]
MRFTYCPFCGSKLVKKEIGDEGMIPFCEKCSVPLWDMFTTSIIVAVVNEYGEVALLRQNYVSTTSYVCVAGIMKLGESAEETVIREVKEEIGQDVESLEFVRSYPYEKKEMLMLGFKATVKKQDMKLSGEVDAAEWVKLEDALSLLREGGIAWQLVKTVMESQER